MRIRQLVLVLGCALLLMGCASNDCAKRSNIPQMDRRRADNSGTNAVPLVLIDGVPLRYSIENVARQAGVNCLFDPRVPGADFSSSAATPEVYIRWENFTIEQVLSTLLDEYNLVMVTNSHSHVYRVLRKGDVTASVASINETRFRNAPVSEVVIDELPLIESFRRLAAEAQMDIVLDRSLAAAPFKLNSQVSFRWRNVRPLDGLSALADNYGLALIEETNSSAIRLMVKPQ
jgi:hypothetical protein